MPVLSVPVERRTSDIMKKNRLFRRIACLGAALALLVPALTAKAAAADKTDAYTAYYEYLRTEIEGLGTADIREADYYKMFSADLFGKMYHSAKVKEILCAYLCDVTGDGVEELILRRRVSNSYSEKMLLNPDESEWLCVYSYINGEVTRIGQVGYWVKKASETSYSMYDPDGYLGSGSVYLCKAADGRYYLSDDEPTIWLDADTFHLFGFDGRWLSPVKTFYANFLPAWRVGSITSSYGDWCFKIDDEYVTMAAMQAAVDQYTAGGVTELAANDYHEVLNTLAAVVSSRFQPSAWAADEVSAAVAKNYVPDALRKDFTSPITRAEFCRLAVRFYEKYTGRVITASAAFGDTQDPAVSKMAGLGVVKGTGNGNFSPDTTLTRQDAAVILMRLADVMHYEPPAAENSFTDRDEIADYALGFVAEAADAGIMNGTGDGRFSPRASYTREQSILTILRMENLSPSVTELTLSRTELELCTTAARQLYVSGKSGSAELSRAVLARLVHWSSSDESVAAVSPGGLVTAVGAGTAEITAEYGGISAVCRVRVNALTDGFYVELPQIVTVDLKSILGDVVAENAVTCRIDSVETTSIDHFWKVTLAVTKLASDATYGEFDLPWRIYDLNGRLLDSGAESVSFGLSHGKFFEGRTFTINVISFASGLDDGIVIEFG